MEWKELIEIAIGAGLVGGVLKLVFRSGKIVQKIDAIAEKLDKFESKTEASFKSINDKLDNVETRISRVEGYLMGPQVLIEKPPGRG